MEKGQKIDKELGRIKEEVLNCKKCSLYKTRKYPVIGEGSHQAKIMFVGEAPGVQEDKTGRPFCGAAGKILDGLLKSIGVERKDVYITNLLKDRPPGNRDPQKEEIEACVPYLERQIEIIKPEVICPLGRYSMKFLMEKFGLKIIPLYHPAVATYNPNMKKILKKDFEVLKKFK
jgi:uracil-DNA glycosylase